jgi:hypothetical protein
LQVWLLPSFPHRALVVTLSVEEGADEDAVRVDDEITRIDVELDLTLDDCELLQSPYPAWQPSPQYAVVLPLILSTQILEIVVRDLPV